MSIPNDFRADLLPSSIKSTLYIAPRIYSMQVIDQTVHPSSDWNLSILAPRYLSGGPKTSLNQ